MCAWHYHLVHQRSEKHVSTFAVHSFLLLVSLRRRTLTVLCHWGPKLEGILSTFGATRKEEMKADTVEFVV